VTEDPLGSLVIWNPNLGAQSRSQFSISIVDIQVHPNLGIDRIDLGADEDEFGGGSDRFA
jgi:hypothetical protein